MHESQMHPVSSFVTLTYSKEYYEPSLNYLDFQLFMRRIRRHYGQVRFFACGEYGDLDWRPHFHALLFGLAFKRDYPVKAAWGSHELSKLWPQGWSSHGDVTHESAAYVARYSCSKVSGAAASSHYTRVDLRTGEYVRVSPEFAHMSLKPGIGYTWFQKYWKEVYRVRDGVCQPGGNVVPAPRYYDKLLDELDGDLREVKDYDRYVASARFAEDCTPERLLVRERCAKAKLAFLRRSL